MAMTILVALVIMGMACTTAPLEGGDKDSGGEEGGGDGNKIDGQDLRTRPDPGAGGKQRKVVAMDGAGYCRRGGVGDEGRGRRE